MTYMMPAQAGAQLLSLIAIAAIARWYAIPWLRKVSRAQALTALLWVHVFRYVALQVFAARHDGFPISQGGALEIVAGDVAGAVLAFAAIALLRARSRLAVPTAWLLALETVYDTYSNISGGVREHLMGSATGVTWMVLSFFVPMVVVSCVLLVWQLISRRGEAIDGRNSQEDSIMNFKQARLVTEDVQALARRADTMRGKIVLITGANSGVGFVTARELAKLGASVLMVCRNSDRGARAQAEVAKTATGPAPELLLADMSSQTAVRALAQDVHQRTDAIDVLINNAGAIFAHREFTAEGVERTFATNHLGAFLLTNLVLDLVCARPGARIINVASEAYGSKLDFDNLQGEKGYGFLSAYFRSKLENIVFTFDLAKRLGGVKVSVNCISPGPTRTGFGNNMTGAAGLFPRLIKLLFQSPEKAAIALIHLASSPEVAGVTGQLFLRGKAIKTKPVTRDVDVAARLWRISAQLSGLPAEVLIPLVTTASEPSTRSAA